MAKRISKKNVSSSDLRDSLRSVKKSSSRLAYFNISEEDIEQNPEKVVKELSHTVAMIPVRAIAPNPDQPRKDFDPEALQELADSLKAYGLIQPVTVRRLGPDAYQLISGERRWKASQLAGLEEIPAYVRLANDQEMMEMALVENIQREDLNAMEVAITYQRLIEEFSLRHEDLAQRVGKKRTTITNFLRLLELPPVVQEAVKEGGLSMGHARALAGLDDFAMQKYLLDKVVKEGISVRALERMVSDYKQPKAKKSTASSAKLPEEYRRVEQSFQEFFGAKNQVKLKLKEKGKGQVVLSFNSVEELNQLLDRLED
ncbi:MAG: ParB/RepB/Spo0J family partition protein [Phaeodactylibacter sp.]|nr:ParB/RepB/Spo0J family partition protein [Phaeodactylibacter sp.]MCB9050049.1 ParB/RepB/Spo0J family partition protein [Lewinellaceae bacterium]